jgi:hypothetical protein
MCPGHGTTPQCIEQDGMDATKIPNPSQTTPPPKVLPTTPLSLSTCKHLKCASIGSKTEKLKVDSVSSGIKVLDTTPTTTQSAIHPNITPHMWVDYYNLFQFKNHEGFSASFTFSFS